MLHYNKKFPIPGISGTLYSENLEHSVRALVCTASAITVVDLNNSAFYQLHWSPKNECWQTKSVENNKIMKVVFDY